MMRSYQMFEKQEILVLLLTANYVSQLTLPRSPLKPINEPVLFYGASNRVTRIFYLEHFVYMLGPYCILLACLVSCLQS